MFSKELIFEIPEYYDLSFLEDFDLAFLDIFLFWYCWPVKLIL